MNNILEKRVKSIQIILSIIAVIAVIAAMKLASSIIVPFLLSAFIAMISAPALFWLTSKKIPPFIAVLIIIFVILLLASALFMLIGNSVNDFTKSIPTYEAQLGEKIHGFKIFLENLGINIPDADIKKYLNPGAVMKLVGSTLNSFGNTLTNSFMILFTVIFMLLEISSFPKKLSIIFTQESELKPFARFSEKIKSYMVIKTLISLGTGLAVFIMLYSMGLKYAFLWGVLAFMLNYIPNIGSIIAALPPVLLAMIQLGSIQATTIGIGFLVINVVAGSIIEPKFMGKGLGLSTLVVFLSLIFWGWILGPVGMLLSVPLTVLVKIAFDSSDSYRWIAVILGPEDVEEKNSMEEIE
jgi:predicted PurR-regulated permease PerM